MREVVIVEATRSAIGKKNGTLAHTHPLELLGPVQTEVLRRAGIDPGAVGQVVGGCVDPVGAQSANVTRNAWLAAGLPMEVPASTVDSQCGSSQHAFNLAVSLVASGVNDVVLACGVENMSMVPLGSSSVDGAKAGHGKPINRTYYEHYEYTSQFEGAERIAAKYGIGRADTDAFGLGSQARARRAIDGGPGPRCWTRAWSGAIPSSCSKAPSPPPSGSSPMPGCPWATSTWSRSTRPSHRWSWPGPRP
jgi:acetyl-CoA C-acetyltransferase